jgi:hypothetical protein
MRCSGPPLPLDSRNFGENIAALDVTTRNDVTACVTRGKYSSAPTSVSTPSIDLAWLRRRGMLPVRGYAPVSSPSFSRVVANRSIRSPKPVSTEWPALGHPANPRSGFMASTAPRPLDRLLIWVFESAWAAYRRRCQVKRAQLVKAARRARKAQRRAERKMARQARAKQKVKKPRPASQPPAVKAQAAQLAIAQKAIEMHRKARQKTRMQPYRQQALPASLLAISPRPLPQTRRQVLTAPRCGGHG